jgi:hypothetical protein
LTRRLIADALIRVAIYIELTNIYYLNIIYSFVLSFFDLSFVMGSEQTRSSSRGWSNVAPKTVGERSALMAKCGRRCFLGPGKTFPICARLGSGSGSGSGDCKIDRRGVVAAYSRAREWASITARKKRMTASGKRAHRRYTAVARRARAILHPR